MRAFQNSCLTVLFGLMAFLLLLQTCVNGNNLDEIKTKE